MSCRYIIFHLLIVCFLVGSAQEFDGMKRITGGTYVPLYGTGDPVEVRSFSIDEFPVTQKQFGQFIEEFPKWKPANVSRLFADKNYLNEWADDDYPLGFDEMPINNISWFAAKAYCECQGKRLPTTDEWEFVSMADETRPDARLDSLYNQKILTSYETPRTNRNKIGQGSANYWGVYDLHGLVWEWTYDFNSVLISGESRKDVDTDRNLFCAAGAVGATDLMNYAAFMRYAFRGSVKANYSVRTLGFRCAKDLNIIE